MSATNYAICPKCIKIKKEEKVVYGDVTEKEYLASIKNHEKVISETLREDYEVYFDNDGNFIIYYGCSCEVCEFKFNYNYKKLQKDF